MVDESISDALSNIKNRETEAAVRELAGRLGASLTAAVAVVVHHELQRLEDDRTKDRQSIQQGFDLIKEIYMDQLEKNNQLLEMSIRQADYRVPAGAK